MAKRLACAIKAQTVISVVGIDRNQPSFNNKGTGIGHDGLEDIIASSHYRDISIIILITYMLFVCI